MDDDRDGVVDEEVPGGCPASCAAPGGGCEDARAITAGTLHACVLDGRGEVACWGSNAHGQLGNVESSQSAVPVRVAGISGATHITANQGMTCAWSEDGAYCWGQVTRAPFFVPLPPGTVQLHPVPIGAVVARDEAGDIHTRLVPGDHPWRRIALRSPVLGMDTYGGRVCFLLDRGVECTRLSGVPDAPSPELTFEAQGRFRFVSMGPDGRMCVNDGVSLRCGPDLDRGEIPGFGPAVEAWFGQHIGCARGDDGQASCSWSWFSARFDDARQLAVGLDFACVLRRDGRVSCVGSLAQGAVGDGRLLDSPGDVPTDVAPVSDLALPDRVMLRPDQPGACQQPRSIEALSRGTDQILWRVDACRIQCGQVLDEAACLDTCVADLGLDRGCFDCLGAAYRCAGPGCRQALIDCAELTLEGIEMQRTLPRIACRDRDCNVGAPVGAPCAAHAECLTDACVSDLHGVMRCGRKAACDDPGWAVSQSACRLKCESDLICRPGTCGTYDGRDVCVHLSL